MTPTTATTGSPPAAAPGDLTVRQRAARPALDAGVRDRIAELHGRGVRTFTLDDFARTAESVGRPLPWIGDHLLILESIGILRPASRSGERRWSVAPGSGYLR